jgi:hypothetical protein
MVTRRFGVLRPVGGSRVWRPYFSVFYVRAGIGPKPCSRILWVEWNDVEVALEACSRFHREGG